MGEPVLEPSVLVTDEALEDSDRWLVEIKLDVERLLRRAGEDPMSSFGGGGGGGGACIGGGGLRGRVDLAFKMPVWSSSLDWRRLCAICVAATAARAGDVSSRPRPVAVAVFVIVALLLWWWSATIEQTTAKLGGDEPVFPVAKLRRTI